MKLELHDDVLEIKVQEFPHYDEAEFWLKLFCHSQGLTVVNWEWAADSAQLRIVWQNFTFDLHYQALSQSLWLSATDRWQQQGLVSLFNFWQAPSVAEK